jgi:cell division septation protein DedD
VRYQFTFERRSLAILALCGLGMGGVIFSAGFLVGLGYATRTSAKTPVTLMPVPGPVTAEVRIPASLPKVEEDRPKIEVLRPAHVPKTPSPQPGGRFAVQVASFAVEENAKRFSAGLTAYAPRIERVPGARGPLFCVRFGSFADAQQAHAAAAAFQREQGLQPMVIEP